MSETKVVTRKDRVLAAYGLALLLYVLINAIVFHGGVYRYLCKPVSYAGNVYGRMQVLTDTEQETGRRPVVLLGDSITEEGIDAALLEKQIGKPVVNLALPGTSPLDWGYFLESIDPDRNRFEAILLTVAPHGVRAQAHDDGIQTLLPVAGIAEMIEYLDTRGNRKGNADDYFGSVDRIYAFRRDLRDLFLSPARWKELGDARQQQLKKIRTYPGQDYDVCSVRIDPEAGRVTRWGEIKDPEIRRLVRTNVRRISKLNRKPDTSGLAGPLQELIASYRHSKTEIIVVSVPFGFGHRVEENSRVILQYLSEIRLAADRPGAEHWMAFDENLFQKCSNFFDFRHLNYKGRELFTNWLAVRWDADRQAVAEIR